MPRPSDILRNKFPYEPTSGQLQLFNDLDDFLDDHRNFQVMVINGYAGTGKTTVISTLVQVLPLFNLKFVLLAPTGRAAKVMSNYSRKVAFTIHKRIYKTDVDADTGNMIFSRQKNYSRNTIFIVDEASMLSTKDEYGRKSLMTDLMDYVFEHDTNRLLLVGDTAQLPPVGYDQSLGLDRKFIEKEFSVEVKSNELTEVMRQEMQSGILQNATRLRNQMGSDLSVRFVTSGFNDIFRMGADRLEDGLRYAYDKFGIDETVVICRSNRSAVQYNQYIRRNIFFHEEMLEVGDRLMVVRNNYSYKDTPAGFIANGDFMEILKVINLEEKYGFRFADLEVRLVDYEDIPPLEGRFILDSMFDHQTSLSQEQTTKLFHQVEQEYPDMKPKQRVKALNEDRYLHALQVKYAYALTCHKSQGGQWKAVFLDQGYLTEERMDENFLKWLYTGLTRATDELYLLNFDQKFFSG